MFDQAQEFLQAGRELSYSDSHHRQRGLLDGPQTSERVLRWVLTIVLETVAQLHEIRQEIVRYCLSLITCNSCFFGCPCLKDILFPQISH